MPLNLDNTKPRISLKSIFRASLLTMFAGLIWLCWPLYGFLSNQYETARLPWGWHLLPIDMPRDEFVAYPKYKNAGATALDVLSKRRKKIGSPSISAAIAIEGKLVWAGAIGWSDVANETPITTQTAYRIGSTSKAVGITGLARLVAADIINLDASISSYLDDLPNEKWNVFTPRQLASHTAGLAAYEENNDWLGFYQSLALTTRFNNPEDALSVFDSADLLFKPGDDFHYSGFDNVLLSAIMQNAAGQPFNHVMSRHVFKPLELRTIRPDHLPDKSFPLAQSYQTKGGKVKPWRSVDLSHKLAAGGYVSTPSDLALMGAAWLNNEFIPRELREIFWKPMRLATGEINEQDYALGFRRKTWPIEGIGEVLHLNHGGVSKGAQCWLMIVPEHDIALAISINRRTDNFFDFADVYVDLLEIFIPASIDAQEKY